MIALDAGFAAQIAAVVLSTAFLAALLWATRAAALRFGLGPEVSRKTVHVAVGLYALSFPFLFRDPVTVALIALCATALLLALRRTAHHRGDRGCGGGRGAGGLGEPLHGVARHSYGDVLFGVSVAFLFFRSGGTLVLYLLPVAVLTLADAAAALTGSAYGRRFLRREEGRKSLEGAAVFFLVTWLVAMIALLLLTDAGRGLVVALSFTIAVLATLIEADSWHGFDNLFVPVAIHLMLEAFLSASPAAALLAALAIAAVWLAVYKIAPRFGMSPQAACATALTIAVLLIATAVHNVVLPVLAIAAHRLAATAHPPLDPFPDLDFITVLALVSLGWLTLGLAMNANAINFFAATILALAALNASIAADRSPRLALLLIAAAIAAGIIAALLNTPPALSGPPLWIAGAAALVVAILAGAIGRGALARDRAAKAGLLAAVLPATIYLFEVMR